MILSIFSTTGTNQILNWISHVTANYKHIMTLLTWIQRIASKSVQKFSNTSDGHGFIKLIKQCYQNIISKSINNLYLERIKKGRVLLPTLFITLNNIHLPAVPIDLSQIWKSHKHGHLFDSYEYLHSYHCRFSHVTADTNGFQ